MKTKSNLIDQDDIMKKGDKRNTKFEKLYILPLFRMTRKMKDFPLRSPF